MVFFHIYIDNMGTGFSSLKNLIYASVVELLGVSFMSNFNCLTTILLYWKKGDGKKGTDLFIKINLSPFCNSKLNKIRID